MRAIKPIFDFSFRFYTNFKITPVCQVTKPFFAYMSTLPSIPKKNRNPSLRYIPILVKKISGHESRIPTPKVAKLDARKCPHRHFFIVLDVCKHIFYCRQKKSKNPSIVQFEFHMSHDRSHHRDTLQLVHPFPYTQIQSAIPHFSKKADVLSIELLINKYKH